MAPIVDWLVEQGFDVQEELDRNLCGRMGMEAETVRWLIDRGADPNWVAPNGIPVLEHALLRYWNGEAVDQLAARATPRKALWISAGLGDLDGVRRFLDAQGKPTSAASRIRPHYDAVGFTGAVPALPEPDDEEILMEAFLVAMINGRTAVMEYLASRGTPVNSLVYGTPVVNIAVGNGWVPVVECLVRCGADLDLRGWQPNQSAREMAREFFKGMPNDADRRRIVELCGMDPDAIVAEQEAAAGPPVIDPGVERAIQLAADDAARLGQQDIRPENLLFGLLRSGGRPRYYLKYQIDLERFHTELLDRLRSVEDRVEAVDLPLSAESKAAIEAAIAFATERRRESVDGIHLLYALTRSGEGAVAELLGRYGASAVALHAELERF